MNDHDLDLLLRHVDPAQSVLDLRGADVALFDEICAQPPVDRLSLLRRRTTRTRRASALRIRLAVSVATAAAMTAVIGVPAMLSGHDDRATRRPAPAVPTPGKISTAPVTFAAAAVRVARDNPRILVTAPGWKVRSVEGFRPEAGEMTFQLGPDQWHDEAFAGGSSHVNEAPRLEVAWYPRDQYESYLADRASEPHVQHVTVLGERAQMVSYSATDHAVMLPPQGKVFLELRGNIGGEAAFTQFLATSVEQVDIRTWLAAMPGSVVTAGNLDAAVRTALEGVPLPPGFDASPLDRSLALDPYQFGARLTGLVACGWIEEWQRARAAGDAAAAARAAEALSTSRQWKVLLDMDAEGDYPEVVWEYADAIASGAPAGKGGAPLTGYRGALGCG